MTAMDATDTPREDTPDTCGARRPGYTHGPAWGRRKLPCVLPTDHDGPHHSAYRDQWGDMDVPEHPHDESAREAGRHSSATREDMPAKRIDARVNELALILANPGHPAHAGIRLRQADRLFGEIDAHLRAGGALPSGWQVDPHASVPTREYTTAAYDIISGELRSRSDVTAARRALASAARWWDALDAAMRDGTNPMPEPWQRAET